MKDLFYLENSGRQDIGFGCKLQVDVKHWHNVGTVGDNYIWVELLEHIFFFIWYAEYP